MIKIPGFRSGKKWKKIIATIGYLFIALIVVGMFNGDDAKTTTAPVTKVDAAPVATPVVAETKTPEQIAQEKTDAELKVKQDAEDKVAAEAKEKTDTEAKVVADKAEAEATIAREAKAIENQKAASTTIPYKDLARNPDTHMYAKVKYTGEVIQVQEDGDNVALRVNVTKNSYGYEDTIMVTYNKGIVEGRVLDKDIVTLYGKYYGLTTYKTVLGAEMTIPKIKVTIIEVAK